MERSFRLDGEKETVVETLAGGGGGSGFAFGSGEEDEGSAGNGDDGVWDLGAKNREMTCCFCLPMTMNN